MTREDINKIFDDYDEEKFVITDINDFTFTIKYYYYWEKIDVESCTGIMHICKLNEVLLKNGKFTTEDNEQVHSARITHENKYTQKRTEKSN